MLASIVRFFNKKSVFLSFEWIYFAFDCTRGNLPFVLWQVSLCHIENHLNPFEVNNFASLLSSGGAVLATRVSAVGSLLRLRWLAYVLSCVLKDDVAEIEK